MNAPEPTPLDPSPSRPAEAPITDADLEAANQTGQQAQQASQEAAEKWEDFKESQQQADAWKETERKVEKATKS